MLEPDPTPQPRRHSVTRVLIALQADLDRHGLRLAASGGGLHVVGQVATGRAALALAERDPPDVVVVDSRLSDMSGVELTCRLLARRPCPRVLLYGESGDEEVVLEALAAGAAGYLTRESSLEELIDGIRTARAGVVPLPLGMVTSLARQLREALPVRAPGPELSPRELAVLRLLTTGMDNTHIAGALSLSPTTVKKHISHVLEKLGVSNRVQAAVYAVRRGIAGPDVRDDGADLDRASESS